MVDEASVKINPLVQEMSFLIFVREPLISNVVSPALNPLLLLLLQEVGLRVETALEILASAKT
jgi:hypothetical protein